MLLFPQHFKAVVDDCGMMNLLVYSLIISVQIDVIIILDKDSTRPDCQFSMGPLGLVLGHLGPLGLLLGPLLGPLGLLLEHLGPLGLLLEHLGPHFAR